MRLTTNILVRSGQFLCLVLAISFLAGRTAEGQGTENCVVDAAAVGQRIDGFGAASAFVDDWVPAWADLFYSTNSGMGLSLLRTRIAPDGTAPGYNMMQYAQARGARVWSTPWTPPVEDKDSGMLWGGKYLSAANQRYANQLAGYVANVKTNYGVNLYAVSVQNEPDYQTPEYESCSWTGNQIHDFVPYLYQALTNSGVGDTKILIAEEGSWVFDLTADTLTNEDTAGMVGIVAAHDYWSFSDAPQATGGKPLWETEVSNLTNNYYDGGIADAMYWAGQIHDFMTVAQANAYHYWWLTALGDNNQGLTDQYGHAAKRLFVFGQYSRFVRPGFYRIGTTNSGQVLVSAYQEPGTGHFAIVAANINLVPITETFTLTNFTTGQLMPWVTSDALSLAAQPAVAVTNGMFSYTFTAQTMVTFTGVTNMNPTMITPIASQTVIPGRTAAFSVSAGGALPLSYAWQQAGTNIAGATNLIYCVTNASVAESGEQFDCVVSNSFGVVTSSVAALTVMAPDCVAPPNGILSWWEGEGTNAVDILAGNNGTLLGGATATNSAMGNGIAFNGTTAYVSMPWNLFAYQHAGPMSFECWFQTTNGGVILAEQSTNAFSVPNNGFVPHIYVGTNGNLYVQMFYPGLVDQIVSSAPVNDGVFHHMVVTYDGVNEILYLDGVEAGITRLEVSNYTGFFYCQLGTGYTTTNWPAGNGGWYSFQGIIAQPTLYANPLTATQVQALYYAGSAGKCTDGFLPTVVTQPTNQAAVNGGTAVFSVSATCASPMTYQWLGGGAPIYGATSTTLTLTEITPVSPTNYAAVVTSYYGSVTSAVATLTVSQPDCVAPPTGIAAWWLDASNGVDVIGGNNAILTGGVGYTNSVAGRGFLFNGGPGYVQLPQNLIPPTNAQPFSMELWFETTAGGVILEQESAPLPGVASSWVPFVYVGIDGNLYVQFFWDGGINQISTSTPVNDGRYHHLAVTYDGSNETVYVDGVVIGTRALAYSSFTANFHCQFGNGDTQYWPAGNGGWYPFTGVIDQPSYYTNALTASQVRAIFIASTAGKCTDELVPATSSSPLAPVSAPLQASLLPGGAVQMTMTNWPGAVFRVLGSTNLVDWQTITNVTNVTGTVQFTDPGATNFSRRFYRMVSP